MFLTFLLSPLGKIVGAVLGILLLAGIIFGWYEVQINNAKREATDVFNKAQLEEVIKEKDALAAQNKILQDHTVVIENENKALNDQLQQEINDANSVINNSTDKDFDPIFNQMLNALKGKK